MDIFIIILMIFAVIGVIDKATGGRLGFEKEIDTGLSTMGTVAVYIVG
ncbi:MAG: ethanolamine utilization protein EutH, partial [Anaerovoracaceae bacterium]